MTDRISITGIEAFANHGVLAHERMIGQRFFADVTLEVDLAKAGASDDLADTIDYGLVATSVRQVMEGGQFNLVEAMAERIAQVALRDPRVMAVDVVVHKPNAPISVPFGDVTIQIRRQRSEA